jgi:hypothetical protein
VLLRRDGEWRWHSFIGSQSHTSELEARLREGVGSIESTGVSTRKRAWRLTQRSSSLTGMRISWPSGTTLSSGCTWRSKWLRLMLSAAAASRRVSV